MSPKCLYHRWIALTATALLMGGCASSPESSPEARPAETSTVAAGTTASGPAGSSAVEANLGEVGGWIAYAGDDGVWAVDPAHPDRRVRLSNEGRDPIAWSSDGAKLLVRRRSTDRSGDLFVLDADGTETRLTFSDFGQSQLIRGGSFSPDGSRVVYAEGRGRSAIYAVSSAGGDGRLILRSTRRVSFPDGHSALAYAYQPALSPDGKRLAYFDGMYDHSHNLWVANADGSNRRRILDDEVFPADHVNALTWSPDEKWLAFTTDGSAYLVRPDGTGLRRLVSSAFVSAPAVQWSPDGSRIAYLRIGDTCTSVTGKDEDFTCADGRLHIVSVYGGEQVIEGLRTPMYASIAWNPTASG